MCLLYYAACHLPEIILVKLASENGLSETELDKLLKTTGHELGLVTECSNFFLDDIKSEQPARVVPGCNHGFHLQCADTWFAKKSSLSCLPEQTGPEFVSDETKTNPC
ncbi:putative Zinc finger, RING/FYVE/PHD-type [Helianthus annuus]|uniref:Zinc finger, RING/FYVE/PHD-type n=1 Tax=Helianthus annuus TaxID=4232 RepID=A0A251S432_HELAN|nr:putative Zinc finger, RING/FYVE/PHD-type [Helianthus annuus]KAJ0449702.1 putative Zinc finger, RING/FYVE/PHD-type [Helianthus annuus]KAJ0471400.1 putative Zinc finger, RING/FYVE/PHD-type [Helianthus annuus]KAJ0647020.1 putative Zinc finger, RING/FYVE/PHD-type [Helianthus annuus]KAJ0650920.1 putative Zinc finger, RING/FYVE/PHD-type [Helianthus annuus]